MTNDPLFPYTRWSNLTELSAAYEKASPFPHMVFESFLEVPTANKLLNEFPKPSDTLWTYYRHISSKKLGKSNLELFPPAIQAVVKEFLTPRFLTWLSQLTGIDELIADPSLEGGGLHQSERGGYLNVHADFQSHYRVRKLSRRLNLLLYLNPQWEDSWNGSLELWNREMSHCEKRILPIFNRAVIFSTGSDSYHGHPDPLRCPPEITRKSIALYYYTQGSKHFVPTRYRARPQDGWFRKWMIAFDYQVIKVYSFLRMWLGLSDKWTGSVFAWINRRWKG